MKKSLVALLFILSTNALAMQMGKEAVEMFQVLNNPQVRDCLDRENLALVNVLIEKNQARCPGCNTYKITGYNRAIDTIKPKKTVITLSGRMVQGSFGPLSQTYSCSVR
jgi:hypothetical protein